MTPQMETVRRAGAAARVLARLERGPATNLELIDECQRISGRVYDLRRAGWDIAVEPVAAGVFRYTLLGRRHDGQMRLL